MTTIHRVKGLEWDYVFIPECDEGWMPLPGDEESGCLDKGPGAGAGGATLGRSPAVESERRLFYVGITRARTACFLSCGSEEERSRFLRDALSAPPARRGTSQSPGPAEPAATTRSSRTPSPKATARGRRS